MKRALICAMFALFSLPSFAQTVANGPYYATPAWDQTLPSAQRLIVLANFNQEAVLDRETGLVWEKSPSTVPEVWDNARRSCNNRKTGGRMGWRLPSVHELSSLLDPAAPSSSGQAMPPTLPAGHPFINVNGAFNPYWSATTLAENATVAWVVFFNPQLVTANAKAVTHLVWCVRGEAALPVY
jgi:hypothetical protein